ncbi:MAG: PAAR domain-containing protein [Terriglobia bacterium]
MPPAARVTDPTTHGAPLSPGPGSTNVIIGGLPAWRAMIDQHACPAVSISGADGVGSVMMGSPTVLINNMMACRLGDIVVEKPGLAMGPVNPIIMGEMTVMIGEVGMGSPVAVVVPPLVGGAVAAQALASSAQNGTPFIKPCPG